jgi:hypothetical protein
MTPTDAARLKLAWQAFQSMQPSEFEITTSAQRILTRMKAPSAARRRGKPALVAVALVMVGALAYAASAGPRIWQPGALPESAAPPPGRAPARVALAPAGKPELLRVEDLPRVAAAPAVSGSAHRRTGLAPPLLTATPASKVVSTPTLPPPVSWGDVAEALDHGDQQAAERGLQQLVSGSDPAARAKARLGLAQLALGRADCTAARRLAAPLVASEYHGVAVRARRIQKSCAVAQPAAKAEGRR